MDITALLDQLSRGNQYIRACSIELSILLALLISKTRQRRILLPIGSCLVLYKALISSEGSNSTIISTILSRYSFNKSSKSNILLLDILSLITLSAAINGVEFWRLIDKDSWFNYMFDISKSIPYIKNHLNKEMNKFSKDFERDLKTPARLIETSIR